VVFIDLVLAGDNAIVVGLAAARVAAEQRLKVIFWGIAAAVVLRIGFALITTRLLAVIGLGLAGGVLLLWVCWKLWRELRASHGAGADPQGAGRAGGGDASPGSLRSAILQIVVADVSMSLDNVLAVAGAAREHPLALAVGLLLSVALMGAAASLIARMLDRVPAVAYLGLGMIFYVALSMIWEGGADLLQAALVLPAPG
jgi:YjbE family integral membrane protein